MRAAVLWTGIQDSNGAGHRKMPLYFPLVLSCELPQLHQYTDRPSVSMINKQNKLEEKVQNWVLKGAAGVSGGYIGMNIHVHFKTGERDKIARLKGTKQCVG